MPSKISWLRCAVCAAVVCVLWVSPVMADWEEGDPAKWEQLPDFSPDSFDVNVKLNVLADDFLCTETGPITAVHLWMSWKNNGFPGNGAFQDMWISFHADEVVGDPMMEDGHRPGTELWRKKISKEYVTEVLLTPEAPILSNWYDPHDPPPTNWWPESEDMYLWNIDLESWARDNGDTLFIQEGTQDTPMIYWMDVQAYDYPTLPMPGWHTTDQGWGSPAMWISSSDYYTNPTNWAKLTYPGGANVGQPMEFAFVIVPEPASLSLLALGGLALIRRRKMTHARIRTLLCCAAVMLGTSGLATAANGQAGAYAWGEILVDGNWNPGTDLSGHADATAMGLGDFEGQNSGPDPFDVSASVYEPTGEALADAQASMHMAMPTGAPSCWASSSSYVRPRDSFILLDAYAESHSFGLFTPAVSGWVQVTANWMWTLDLADAIDLPPYVPEPNPNGVTILTVDFHQSDWEQMLTMEEGLVDGLGYHSGMILYDAAGFSDGDSGSGVWTVYVEAGKQYNLVVETWTSVAAGVPEPATLGLLAFGSLAVLRRRRV